MTSTRGWRRPGAAPSHAPHRERPPRVGRVHRGRVSRRGPPCRLEAGPGELARREGVTRAAGHGTRAAVAQTLLAGAGGARVDDRRAGGGQRVGEVALPSYLPSEACGFVDLRQRCKIHYVVVSVRAEVRRALARLETVFQQDRSTSLIRSPSSLVVGPLPVDTAAQA